MNTEITFSFNEIIKDAQRIREFRGDNDYALTSFIREVDSVLTLVGNNIQAQDYIINRVVLNKIQGDALHTIRTLGPNPNWNAVKTSLINNYGVKETYNQLYKKAFATEKRNVSNVFKYLCNILAKLNEKYEFDPEKPQEFCPSRNESIISKTFLSNININLSSIIINKNICNLREAYNLLVREDLISSNENYHNFSKQVYKKQNYPQHKTQKPTNHKYPEQHNNSQNHSGQYRSNSSEQYRPNSSGHYRSNSSGQYRSNSSGQYRSNSSGKFRQNNNLENNSGQHRQNFSGQNKNNYHRHYDTQQNTHNTNTQNSNEPMEIDHISESNFPSDPIPTIHR